MPEQEIEVQCPIRGPQSFVACPIDEVAPLVEHLQNDWSIDASTNFPRGTLLPDGRLDLCKQDLGPEGCRQVTNALRANTRVRSLLLGTDGIGDGGAQAVADLVRQNQVLEVVYLGCNNITEVGVTALAESLLDSPSVQGLWLKRNPIGVAGAREIAKLLRSSGTLRVLDLVNTGIGKSGLCYLLEALKDDRCKVTRLYLGGNGLDADDAKLMADLLRCNTALRSLMLNVNRIGDEGAIALAAGLRENSCLTELGLGSNGITERGGRALIAAAADQGQIESLDLGYSPSTRVLGAEANFLGDGIAVDIARLLKQNQNLRRLNLIRTSIGTVGRRVLSEAIEASDLLVSCKIDGHLPPSVRKKMENNAQQLAGTLGPPEELALIASVYRTAKKK